MVQEQNVAIMAQTPFKFGDALDSFAINQYHSLKEIYDWVDTLVATYPDRVSTVSIGSSFEKREMKVVKIGKQGENKPGYFIDAGIHAREWISPATAVFIINELATKYDSNPTYKELVDKVDFYILPSLNPDGYEYSRSGITSRLWRKTRSGPYGVLRCRGVDANRNFDFHWKESGASPIACMPNYAGPKAHSESEVVNVVNFLGSHNDTLRAYTTLHSYSDLFMYSYSYKGRAYPPDIEELKALANEAVAAIQAVHGTKFEAGTPADILYEVSGSSHDWAKGVANIKYSYALELRPGNGDPDKIGRFYGFMLPASYIIPVGEETWAGLQVIAKKLISA